ncbi:MAG: hypothetical protein FJ042_01990 [Candidatus Cloacimonetes bacterium]|nr:hypothetical protein [Candidatus Cloacimonadota bacterium]
MKMYKRIIIILILLAGTTVALLYFVPGKDAILAGPQSIVYDATNDVYYISNGSSNSIVAMDAEGNYTGFVNKGLNQPRGLIMAGANLWVVEPQRISAIDLLKKTIAYSIDLPESKSLTDIAADENGMLYVTDTGGDCLWVVDPSTREKTRVSDPRLSKPTGIVYDHPRYQMLLVSGADYSPVFAYDIRAQTLDIHMDTLYGDLRGIAIDPETGAIYFSSVKQKMIVEITLARNRPEPFIRDIDSVGDMIFDANHNALQVPLIKQNTIKLIELGQDSSL